MQEVARLPVLAGSRVLFYLSWEAGISDEYVCAVSHVVQGAFPLVEKLTVPKLCIVNWIRYRNKPARAQVVARAQENMIYVVHANAGAGPGGSHGQSRIVDPYGTVLVEAPIWGDYLFTRLLDFSELPGPMGLSYNGWPGYIGNEAGAQQLFADWWKAGMKLMRAMPIELGVLH